MKEKKGLTEAKNLERKKERKKERKTSKKIKLMEAGK